MPLCIHGAGTQTRNYLYIDDVVNAFDLMLHHGLPGNAYNIGTDFERDVLSVAQDVCGLLGRDPDACIQHVADRHYNDRRYRLDNSKLAQLGWVQGVPWLEGLARTVEVCGRPYVQMFQSLLTRDAVVPAARRLLARHRAGARATPAPATGGDSLNCDVVLSLTQLGRPMSRRAPTRASSSSLAPLRSACTAAVHGLCQGGTYQRLSPRRHTQAL